MKTCYFKWLIRLTLLLPMITACDMHNEIQALKQPKYEVSDEYQGDIEKAHWESQPIMKEKISFLK